VQRVAVNNFDRRKTQQQLHPKRLARLQFDAVISVKGGNSRDMQNRQVGVAE
jgi:hypothetical protein